MTTQLHRSLAILLVFLLAAVTAASPPAPPVTPPPAEQAQEAMPDGLMSAFLEASSQPFTPDVDGYRAHSGGLDFALDATGLQANLGSFALRLALRAWGREGQLVTLPDVQIAQADGRLEYHRGALTEWYRDTALGVEQGFTIHQPPGGKGPLVLQLDLATNLVGEADADGHGLSFTTPDGQTLRYDHLRAWDADAVPLEVCLGYTRGQVRLQVNDQSATYPVTVDPLIYAEQQVTASDGEAYDSFGYSVALWGNTALVGAPDGYMSTGPDSAYVFTWTESGWSEQQKLTASDGETWDGFGRSVALWGDTALVGAFADDVDTNSDQGSAYVFTRDGTTWSEQAHLTASDGAAADYFGGSVALWDDTALVGAAFHDAGQGEYQGSAYVFTRSATTWSEQARLTASDAASGDLFGYSVALWGDTALVGASWDGVGLSEHQGSAYVFTRSGTSWSEQQKLTASDGEEGDSFGSSVALEGETALVGAIADDAGANSDQGSVYVFVRTGITWSEQARLTASDAASGDLFGYSVALSGDTALVGAVFDDVGSNGDQGSVYIFARSGTTWSEQAQLTPSHGAPGDRFGASVALWGNTALVGVPDDSVGISSGQGSAYFYDPCPVVKSIRRTEPSPTNAPSVSFAVTFSEDVTGVDSSDFAPNSTGSLSGASVTAVNGSGAAYTVTVSTGTGSGTLRLDVPTIATITDLTGNSLTGLPYADGEIYTVDKAAPAVLAITRTNVSPTRAPVVDFAVTFSEDVTGVGASDFASSITGSLSGASVVDVSGSGATYTVTVSTGSGMGTLRLDVPASATITDLAGNPLSALPYTSGEAYTIAHLTYLPLVLRTMP